MINWDRGNYTQNIQFSFSDNTKKRNIVSTQNKNSTERQERRDNSKENLILDVGKIKFNL